MKPKEAHKITKNIFRKYLFSINIYTFLFLYVFNLVINSVYNR
jgi:hypothetical protein